MTKHLWKFVLIFMIFGIVGQMDYEDQVAGEEYSQAYYDEVKQRYGREYAAVENIYK